MHVGLFLENLRRARFEFARIRRGPFCDPALPSDQALAVLAFAIWCESGIRERIAMAINVHRTGAVFECYNVASDEDLRPGCMRHDGTSRFATCREPSRLHQENSTF